MNKEAIIKKLREDEHYYGEFGKQYLSNSDIKTLTETPSLPEKNLNLGKFSTRREGGVLDLKSGDQSQE